MLIRLVMGGPYPCPSRQPLREPRPRADRSRHRRADRYRRTDGGGVGPHLSPGLRRAPAGRRVADPGARLSAPARAALRVANALFYLGFAPNGREPRLLMPRQSRRAVVMAHLLEAGRGDGPARDVLSTPVTFNVTPGEGLLRAGQPGPFANPRGNNEGSSDDRYACFFDLDTWRDYALGRAACTAVHDPRTAAAGRPDRGADTCVRSAPADSRLGTPLLPCADCWRIRPRE
jgi:hypothetical protein